MDEIKTIPLLVDTNSGDELCWKGDNTGKFSVCSAFNVIAGLVGDDEEWMWLWNMNCWEKIKMFLWLAVKDKVLMNRERARRHLTEDARCPTCGEEEETLRHIFWDCNSARAVWRRTWGLDDFSFPQHFSVANWIKSNASS